MVGELQTDRPKRDLVSDRSKSIEDAQPSQEFGLAERLCTFLAACRPDVIVAYLFGSRARGTARPDSDIDVGVLFESERPQGLDGLPLELEYELERQVGRPVQVVDLDRAPADLVHRVLRDGILLLDRDSSRRIRFEVTRRNEFFDLQPILREYRRPRSRKSR